MQISRSSLLAFVNIACQCLNSQPSCRPTMAEIVVVLEFALALQQRPDDLKGFEGTNADYGAKYSTAVEMVYGADQNKAFKINRSRVTFSRKVCQILSATIRTLSVHSNAKNTSYTRNRNSRIDKKMRLNQISIFPEANNRIRLNKIGILPETNNIMRFNKIGYVPQAKGGMVTANLRMFTFAELGSATRGFSPDMMLGEGNYGRVFIGWLDEDTFAPSRIGIGMAVAVKRCNSNERFKAVQTEVDLCGRFYHPNIVKLLGFCSEGEEFMLVYEYTPKGNLERYTYKDSGKSLSWVVWLKILIGAARYLAFLHSSEDRIVYGDFRPSNILLDGDFNPKMCDSGHARCAPDDADSCSDVRTPNIQVA
nr:PREDICTED: protein kinase 2B, chloroplastic-like [Daucus carota subsp. sativus]